MVEEAGFSSFAESRDPQGEFWWNDYDLGSSSSFIKLKTIMMMYTELFLMGGALESIKKFQVGFIVYVFVQIGVSIHYSILSDGTSETLYKETIEATRKINGKN